MKMSKRFGRNQKRKLLENIDFLNTISENQSKTIIEQGRTVLNFGKDVELLRKQMYENEYIVQETKRIFGQYFIALKPETVNLNTKDLPPEFAFHIQQDFECMDFRASGNDSSANLMRTYKYLQTTKGKAYKEELRGMVHFYLQSTKGEVGYCIDWQMRKTMPEKYLIEFIAKELVRELQKVK